MIHFHDLMSYSTQHFKYILQQKQDLFPVQYSFTLYLSTNKTWKHRTIIVSSCNWINRLLLQEQWELIIIKEVAEKGRCNWWKGSFVRYLGISNEKRR